MLKLNVQLQHIFYGVDIREKSTCRQNEVEQFQLQHFFNFEVEFSTLKLKIMKLKVEVEVEVEVEKKVQKMKLKGLSIFLASDIREQMDAGTS